MRKFFLIGAVALSLATADCDVDGHRQHAENEKAVQACKDKGGIAVVKVVRDGDGHAFVVLDRCDFPPLPPTLQGERK